MSVTWLNKEKLLPTVTDKIERVDVVLDIGCGIMPQQYVRPLIHICCEPFSQYVEHLKEKTQDDVDRLYFIIKAGWQEVVDKFPAKSVDSIFLIDIVEHLEKKEGLRLLNLTERIARKQIVLFTPLGFFPQDNFDGKDAWGLQGGTWQEHKSGWLPDDFNESWDIYASEEYHLHDNTGMPFKKPFGAFWAIKNLYPTKHNDNVIVANYISILDDVILCLESFGMEIKRADLILQFLQKYKALAKLNQQLKDEYQQLKQSRALVLTRKLKKYPLLMKLISVGYDTLVKFYNRLKRKK